MYYLGVVYYELEFGQTKAWYFTERKLGGAGALSISGFQKE